MHIAYIEKGEFDMFNSSWGSPKKLVIIYDKDSKMFADYLFQMISANNKIGENTVSAVLWNESQFKSNEATWSSENYVLFVGDSDLAKETQTFMNVMYNKAGVHYLSLGKKAVLYVDDNGLDETGYADLNTIFEKYKDELEKKDFSSFNTKHKNRKMAALTGLVLFTPLSIVGVAGAAAVAIGGNKLLDNKKEKEQIRITQCLCATMMFYHEFLPKFLEE